MLFRSCEDLSTSEKIRGNYENKIRFFAPPEKIFETFATIKENENVFMTYSDFFFSLTPFSFHKNSEEENEKSYFDKFTPEVLKIADINGDGKIDFPEFIFFLTLLQLPESEIYAVFKKKGKDSKTFSKEEFIKEFTHL